MDYEPLYYARAWRRGKPEVFLYIVTFCLFLQSKIGTVYVPFCQFLQNKVGTICLDLSSFLSTRLVGYPSSTSARGINV